jgi:hypothetical protein
MTARYRFPIQRKAAKERQVRKDGSRNQLPRPGGPAGNSPDRQVGDCG